MLPVSLEVVRQKVFYILYIREMAQYMNFFFREPKFNSQPLCQAGSQPLVTLVPGDFDLQPSTLTGTYAPVHTHHHHHHHHHNVPHCWSLVSIMRIYVQNSGTTQLKPSIVVHVCNPSLGKERAGYMSDSRRALARCYHILKNKQGSQAILVR